jgi:hypothetical protein
VVLVAHDQLVEGGKLTADGLPDQGDVDLLARVLDPARVCLHLVGHDSPISHVDSTAA